VSATALFLLLLNKFQTVTPELSHPLSVAVDGRGLRLTSMENSVGVGLHKLIEEWVFLGIVIASFDVLRRTLQHSLRLE